MTWYSSYVGCNTKGKWLDWYSGDLKERGRAQQRGKAICTGSSSIHFLACSPMTFTVGFRAAHSFHRSDKLPRGQNKFWKQLQASQTFWTMLARSKGSFPPLLTAYSQIFLWRESSVLWAASQRLQAPKQPLHCCILWPLLLVSPSGGILSPLLLVPPSGGIL